LIQVDVPVIRDLASQVLPKPEPPKVETKPPAPEEAAKPVVAIKKEPSVEREVTPVREEPPKPEVAAAVHVEDKSDGSEMLSPDAKADSPHHEEITTRSRRGGRSRRGNRGGISTRRSARGSGSRQGWDGSTEALTVPDTKEKPESQAEESSEEHKEEVKVKKPARKGRKKKLENETEDKSKPRATSECNDVYEFHDSDDNDFQFETKSVPSLSPVKSEEKPQLEPPPQEVPAPVLVEEKSEEPEAEMPSEPHSEHPVSEDESKLLHPPLSVITNVKSPPATRKSRRLIEKDTSRNTVDDIIEAVVRGKFSSEEIEALAAKKQATRAQSKEEEERKPLERPIQSSPVKVEEQQVVEKAPEEKPVVAPCTPVVAPPKISPPVPPKIVEPLKVATQPSVLHVNKVPGEQPEEPTTLIDPVTGLLIPMRESEEGQYIPVSTSSGVLVLNSADSRLLGRQPQLVR
jgi:hypothetical protein